MTDTPAPVTSGADLDECISNIRFFANDLLDNGHLFGGAVGSVMAIRDEAGKIADYLATRLRSPQEPRCPVCAGTGAEERKAECFLCSGSGTVSGGAIAALYETLTASTARVAVLEGALREVRAMAEEMVAQPAGDAADVGHRAAASTILSEIERLTPAPEAG